MTDLREAAQMALDVLELVDGYVMGKHEAKEALYEALAQPEADEDYEAIANKQLASLKEAGKKTFEDAAVRAFHKLYNAQPEPETVGYLTNALGHEWVFSAKRINQYSVPLYTAPPRKEWIELTKEEVRHIVQGNTDPWCDTPETDGYGVAEMVEAKLREKNGNL